MNSKNTCRVYCLPDHEEHCQHTLKRYNVRGDDIHSFIDEPSKLAGQGHRIYRHDTKTIKLVGEIFGGKYGREVAESIALDHITADHEEEIKRRNKGLILMKCPNCGGQLEVDNNGLKKCVHCGFSSKIVDNDNLTIESIKLPAKDRIVLLYRKNDDLTLPEVLPPLCINGYYQSGSNEKIIDDVYAGFEDKATVELILEHVYNYSPISVSDLRLDQYGNMTDKQIKELLLKSKSVASQKIEELLNQPKVKQIQTEYKRHLVDQEKRNNSLKPVKTLALPLILATGAVWLFYQFAEPIYLLMWAAVGFGSGLFLNFLWGIFNPPQTLSNRMSRGSERIAYVKMLKRSQESKVMSRSNNSDGIQSINRPIGSSKRFWLVLASWLFIASILGYIFGYVYVVGPQLGHMGPGSAILLSSIFLSSVPVFAWMFIAAKNRKKSA